MVSDSNCHFPTIFKVSCVCMFITVCIYLCVCVYIYIYTYICTYIHIYVNIYTCIHIYIYLERLYECGCVCVCVCQVTSVMSASLWPQGLYPARLLCSWDSPGKNTGEGSQALLQGIFPTQGLNLCLLWLLHCRWILYHQATGEAISYFTYVCTLTIFIKVQVIILDK